MNYRTLATALALAVALAAPSARPAQAAPLRAGLAVIDITPPIGYRMSGYFSERRATGVKDPLRAKVLVLHQGEVRAALVFCDLIGISRQLSDRVRRDVRDATGIPFGNILIAATHTHTGPLYAGALRDHFRRLAIDKHGKDPCEPIDYLATTADKIVQAVRYANATITPVRLDAGNATQHGLSFNRRFHMKGGPPVRFNPGVLNPNIVRPAGPIDPQVGIVLVRDAASGKPRAALVNFALHLDTTGGTEFSADYPRFLEQWLHAKLGDDLVVLFGTGACGDINHVNVKQRARLKPDHIGRTLAATVNAALPTLTPTTQPALAVRRKVVLAPIQRYSLEQVAKARDDMAHVASRKVPFLKRVEATKIVALQSRGGTALPLEVQVFRLGTDLAIVGLPGEVFVDLGLAIKKASPFATTLVVELCHDAQGYIPTKKAFAEGSYETVNSRVQPGGGEMMVEAANTLLKELGPHPE